MTIEETPTGTNYELFVFIRLPFKPNIRIWSASTNHQTYNDVISEWGTTISCGDRNILPSVNACKERLWKFCNMNSVENENQFWMLFPLYSDIRYELFQKALEVINNFNIMNVENKFIELINCNKIQIMLAHTLHNFVLHGGKYFYET